MMMMTKTMMMMMMIMMMMDKFKYFNDNILNYYSDNEIGY